MHNPLTYNTATEQVAFATFEAGVWTAQPGAWEIQTPLVLEGTLNIPAGTTLRFAADAYLVVKGSMNAEGEADAPVVMESSNGTWKGLYILGGGEKSRWRHVRIQDYAATEDGLLSLTGGVTLYRADVDMENVELNRAQGEDALNLVQSQYSIRSLTIRDAASDGLDSDFSKGLITDSFFINIGGDAVDFSGSTVEINSITASGIYDKAVSVGEASTVTVSGGDFTGVGVAIVSKDGSKASASNVRISDYALAGAMSYKKKSFYGEAGLALDNVDVSGESPFIRQTGSNLTYDGQPVREQDVDVDYLYENTVMKK
jgi:hypothetical protein